MATTNVPRLAVSVSRRRGQVLPGTRRVRLQVTATSASLAPRSLVTPGHLADDGRCKC